MSDAVGANLFEIFGAFLVEFRFYFILLYAPPCMHERPKKVQSAKNGRISPLFGGLKSDEKKKNLIVLAVTGGRR